MLEQLLGLIQDNSQDAIVRNPAVPDQHNNDVMQTILGSITGGLQQQAQGGNLQDVMGLLTGNATQGGMSGLMSNPVASSISNNAIGSIMEKFGLDSSAASGIVASVLPGVLSGLVSKVSNPGDASMDFNGLLGGGNQTSSAGFDFNQIGYALADGKLDMNDLMRVGGSLFGGNSQNQSQQGGFDIGGMLGGLFGK